MLLLLYNPPEPCLPLSMYPWTARIVYFVDDSWVLVETSTLVVWYRELGIPPQCNEYPLDKRWYSVVPICPKRSLLAIVSVDSLLIQITLYHKTGKANPAACGQSLSQATPEKPLLTHGKSSQNLAIKLLSGKLLKMCNVGCIPEYHTPTSCTTPRISPDIAYGGGVV